MSLLSVTLTSTSSPVPLTEESDGLHWAHAPAPLCPDCTEPLTRTGDDDTLYPAVVYSSTPGDIGRIVCVSCDRLFAIEPDEPRRV
jgi:hypothetical protein